MKHKQNHIITTFSRIVFIMIGAALVSIGLEIFLLPNNVIDGGITGISIIASHLTGISLGVFIVLLNLPFVIIGYKKSTQLSLTEN